MGRRGCWDSRERWSGGGKGLPFERRRGWRETDDDGWLVEMAQAGGGGDVVELEAKAKTRARVS